MWGINLAVCGVPTLREEPQGAPAVIDVVKVCFNNVSSYPKHRKSGVFQVA